VPTPNKRYALMAMFRTWPEGTMLSQALKIIANKICTRVHSRTLSAQTLARPRTARWEGWGIQS